MGKIVKLSVCCKICQQVTLIENVDLDGYNSWHAGTVIQKALPDVSADHRELMISNICPHCWEHMFPPEEEDDFPGLDDSLAKKMPDYEMKTGNEEEQPTKKGL